MYIYIYIYIHIYIHIYFYICLYRTNCRQNCFGLLGFISAVLMSGMKVSLSSHLECPTNVVTSQSCQSAKTRELVRTMYIYIKMLDVFSTCSITVWLDSLDRVKMPLLIREHDFLERTMQLVKKKKIQCMLARVARSIVSANQPALTTTETYRFRYHLTNG